MSVLPSRSSGTSINDGGILRKGARIPGPLAPNGAVMGDLWYNTANKTLNVWNGTAWDKIMGGGVSVSGGNVTATGTITADRFAVRPNDTDDYKIDLYNGEYVIGVRAGELYMRSSPGTFSWEGPAGSWGMRYGWEVNGAERGLHVQGNLQGVEIYAESWFRNMSMGEGWYNQSAGGGLFFPDGDSTWVQTYGGKYIYANGWISTSIGVALRDHDLRIRSESDGGHYLAYRSGRGSPANGFQSFDGPFMAGWSSAGLGSARFDNMAFRVWDTGGDYRTDVYSPLHVLQGLAVDGGSKSFLIDHPVLGPTHHLQYAAIEAPAIDLLWRGRIKLKAGKAIVNIDDEVGQEEGTFEALTFEEGRQFFLYNETGEATPHGKWIPGAGDLEITCSDNTATVGWLILAVRKAGLEGGHGLDENGHLLVEWEKTPIELETTEKIDHETVLDSRVAELEQWKLALPGSERTIDAEIEKHKARRDDFKAGRAEHKEKMRQKAVFWNAQKTKAKQRKKQKGR